MDYYLIQDNNEQKLRGSNNTKNAGDLNKIKALPYLLVVVFLLIILIMGVASWHSYLTSKTG